MNDMLKAEMTRRRFFCALVASAVAAGVALPVKNDVVIWDAAGIDWGVKNGDFLTISGWIVYDETTGEIVAVGTHPNSDVPITLA